MKVSSLLLAAATFVATLLPCARAAEPFRLDRVAISRFTAVGSNKLKRETGVLHSSGRIDWRGIFEVERPANTPAWALNRTLIRQDAWTSYRALGTQALRNFTLEENFATFPIGDESFYVIALDTDGNVPVGSLINISTRARLTTGGDSVIAGFVIEGEAKKVLIRAVGPGLAGFGVRDAAPDPRLTLLQGRLSLYLNDDWNQRHDAADVREAAQRVGAFPLAEGSKDAALLVELPAGTYSVQLDPAGVNPQGGTVLVEIYSVPEL